MQVLGDLIYLRLWRCTYQMYGQISIWLRRNNYRDICDILGACHNATTCSQRNKARWMFRTPGFTCVASWNNYSWLWMYISSLTYQWFKCGFNIILFYFVTSDIVVDVYETLFLLWYSPYILKFFILSIFSLSNVQETIRVCSTI